MTQIHEDGSTARIKLVVEEVNGRQRLYEDLDNYFGDYMLISGVGSLEFYDNEGYIFSLEADTTPEIRTNTEALTDLISQWF